MNIETTKLLSLLVYPLNQSLILLILAMLLLWFGARRSCGLLLLLAIGWLWASSTAMTADWLMGQLERDYRPRALAVTPEADAIVVLGGATRGDTHMSSLGDLNQAADRLVHAVALYRAGKAPRIVLSGGSRPGGRPEAQLMQEILEVMGVPARAILTEEASRDTFENASFSQAVLAGKGIKRILLVTSAYHMRRSEALFRASGFEVIPAPTDYQRLVAPPLVPRWLPTAEDLETTSLAIHEYVGYWAYALGGRL